MAVLYRSISRDFFSNASIADLSPLARLLYIATWLEADREGRLVWHLKTLRLRYLPIDHCDINALADELVSSGLVVPYFAHDRDLAFIPGFQDFQVINGRETQSKLPPPDPDAIPTRDQHNNNVSAHVPDASNHGCVAHVGMECSGVDIPSHRGDGLPTTSTTECIHGAGVLKISSPRKFLAGSKGGA